MSEINNNQMPIQPGQAAQPGQVAQPGQTAQPPAQNETEKQPPVVPMDDALRAQGVQGQVIANMGPVKVAPAETAMVAATSPSVINQSDVLFRAAMKAGLSYPEAATFATEQ